MEVLYCTQCCTAQQLIKSVVAYINKKEISSQAFQIQNDQKNKQTTFDSLCIPPC